MSKSQGGLIAAMLAMNVGACLLVSGCTPEQQGSADPPRLAEFRPEVDCQAAGCTVRIAALVGGRALLSEPLPFEAPGAEMQQIPVDASFGLGSLEGRALTAWSIGLEERGIAVALEPVSIGAGQVVIVHQTAGFDHVKRAHVVLQLNQTGLKTHLELVEGPGPEIISLWPEAEGVAVGRSIEGGTDQIHHYRWHGAGATLSLKAVN